MLPTQASEGVPNRFFSVLSDLVEAYYSPNMGLVTHLQYPVPKEEGLDDDTGTPPSSAGGGSRDDVPLWSSCMTLERVVLW